MPSIIVKDSSGERTYSLEDHLTIGRDSSNIIRLNDMRVSKKHARIRKIGLAYVYEDMGSSNGSFYRGSIISQCKLNDGDVIQLGDVELIFQEYSLDEDTTSMFDISQVFDAGLVQERIKVGGRECFQPEAEVSDLTVLREDYEKLRLGSDLMQRLGMQRDLKAVLHDASHELLRIFRADSCVILLLQKNSNKLVPNAMCSEDANEHVTVSESVLREVQDNKLAVLSSDVMKDERFSSAKSLMVQGVRSVMCVPIIYGDDFLGVVHLDSKKHGIGGFSRKDLNLLIGIVHYIAMAIANANLIKEVEKEARFKAQFERLLSPSVAEQVMRGKVSLDKGGELRDVTILFADIRGFTALFNRSKATRIVGMLNRYFEMIVDIVFRHGGTVDKYIGDEIMVLFGAPIAMDDAADRAVTCALEMQAALVGFNAEQQEYEEDIVQIGVGINSGEVVVGSIGSTRTMQYTCIGGAVNVASRLTDIAKPGEVVISDDTKKHLKKTYKCEALEDFTAKGIEGSMHAWYIYDNLEDTKD